MPTARFVSLNSSESVRPTATHSAANWAASLFGSFGGAVYNRFWGTNGALIWCLTGGHLSASNGGFLIFDLDTFQFSFQPCTNSGFTELNSTGTPADWPTSGTSGANFFEITGVTGNMPTPTHCYAMLVALNQGTKGKILVLAREATCQESNNSGSVHLGDPATGLWSRFTSNINPIVSSPFNVQGDGTAIYDEANGVVYSFSADFHNTQRLQFLTIGTGVFGSSTLYSFPSTMQGGSFSMDAVNGFIIAHDQSVPTIRVMDLNNIAGGWNNATVTGSLDTADHSLWCHYPPDGNFYRLPASGGNTLQRLKVNSVSAVTVDTITLTGDSVPAYGDGGNVVSAPYRSLVYAPNKLKMYWASGNGTAISNNQQITEIDPRVAPPTTLHDTEWFTQEPVTNPLTVQTWQ